MRIRAKWGSALSPRLPTKILIGLLSGTLLASAGLLAFPSQSFSVGDLNLAAADTIRGSGGGRLASNPALSGDGSTVIFGQPGHWGWAGTPRATVEVREWNGSSWVAKGALPDAANREIGHWHDISDNGDVVSYSTSVLDKVFVADWSGSAWVQRPTITASQAGGSLVRHSLSGDGNVLVLGERGFDNGGEVNNGKVRTLDWDGSSWSERTAIIGAEGEQLGNSRMDITADGATISFGGSLYSSADGAEVGRVRVATWDGASWTERQPIVGSQASARAANAVLSNDGQVLAFSEAEFRVSGRVRTFDWSGSSWSERPVAAEGSTAWIDVDLNASGTAISMSDNDTQKVRIYDWVGDAWVQRGSDVPTFAPGGGGHYGNVASLSSSGLSVATSQIYSDINGSRSGRIDIFRSTGALKGVTFHSNGGSGAMSTQAATGSASLSSNSFTRSGYVFSGWNTAADGTGTSYSDGATYSFGANLALYAQWAWAPSYYPSGPQTNVTTTSVTGGGWELCWSGPYNGFATFSSILAACDGDYVMYTGWSGVSTSPETVPTSLPLLAAAPRSDVFATTPTARIADATSSNGSKWYFGDDRGAGPDGPQAVGFTDNQSGSPCYSGSLSICWHSAPNLPGSYGWADGSASPSWAATEAGLSPGWSLGTTTFLGQSPAMGNGANYTRAIFHASNPNKSVTFSANSGSGSMSAQSASSSSALSSNSFTRSGYTFSGWNTSADGSGTAYADGASYDFAADLTLYAQWAVVVAASGSSSSSVAGGAVAVRGGLVAQGRGGPEAPRRGGLVVRGAPAVIDREVRAANAEVSNKAVALVGGEEVAISARTQGSQAAQFATGNVSLDIAVAEDHGVVDAVNGAPALKVARNSPASLKGAGLLPNSRLQVFLPASDGSFIEMPALEVNAEGSFEGSLTFGTSRRGKPMPIGPRFIQIVGLDEDGIETVLDIPVTIAQPLPAPEINRVSGDRPVLEPGQTMAFNAGEPETVTVKRSGSTTSVEGEGWVFTVESDSPETAVEAMSFTRDAPVTFRGEGFMPGTRADVWLFSDPTLLGTVDIKEDGTFTALFAVDSAFVPTGNHTLQIQGVGDDGFVRAANLGVQVVDPLDSPVAPVGGQRFDLMPLAVMGTAVLGFAVLTAVVVALRRRRKSLRGLVPAL